ncbi:MAG: hypothetical protein K2X57_03450 [Xanthobacteraceae bacterium]|nr:hypothetical protein [Xanthobacteraceae bacterium]MBY0611236.1 hypothetical protein [Beijerinckiaceae bacterium]
MTNAQRHLNDLKANKDSIQDFVFDCFFAAFFNPTKEGVNLVLDAYEETEFTTAVEIRVQYREDLYIIYDLLRKGLRVTTESIDENALKFRGHIADILSFEISHHQYDAILVNFRRRGKRVQRESMSSLQRVLTEPDLVR